MPQSCLLRTDAAQDVHWSQVAAFAVEPTVFKKLRRVQGNCLPYIVPFFVVEVFQSKSVVAGRAGGGLATAEGVKRVCQFISLPADLVAQIR